MRYPGTRFRDVLSGTGEDDELLGFGDNDELYGGGGTDVLNGGEGADRLDGGDGFDTASYMDATSGVYVRLDTGSGYSGEAAGDVLLNIEHLSGSSHDDVLVGDAGSNTLWGNGGNDLLFGLDGADALAGGSGDDHLWGGVGADRLYGADGFDYARYDYAAAGVKVELTDFGGNGLAGEALGDALLSIEGLVGSQFNDTFIGNGSANALLGLAGDDMLFGEGGDDQLLGGEGSDYIDGGTGFDYVRYDDAVNGISASLQYAYAFTGPSTDTVVNVEGVFGSGFDDVIEGDGSANVLFGNHGGDALRGLGGADALIGGDGDDTLIGGDGADYLQGDAGFDFASYETATAGVAVDLAARTGTAGEASGDILDAIEGLIGSAFADALAGSAGNNIIIGGLGSDSLSGGAGDDHFMFSRADFVADHDVVMDFGTTAGNADTLVLFGITSAEIVLTDVAGGTRVSIGDASFTGDILVLGLSSATLSGHLLFA